jgi:hypothetical protein
MQGHNQHLPTRSNAVPHDSSHDRGLAACGHPPVHQGLKPHWALCRGRQIQATLFVVVPVEITRVTHIWLQFIARPKSLDVLWLTCTTSDKCAENFNLSFQAT